MHRDSQRRYIVDILFVLALFFVFAVTSILLIAIGASIYRRNTDSMEHNYTIRSSHAYLAEKMRAADTAGAVSIGETEGFQTLLLRQEINGISYVTRLYLYEGCVTELFHREDVNLPASAGMQLMEVSALSFSRSEDGIILADVTETDGYTHRVMMTPKSSP